MVRKKKYPVGFSWSLFDGYSYKVTGHHDGGGGDVMHIVYDIRANEETEMDVLTIWRDLESSGTKILSEGKDNG